MEEATHTFVDVLEDTGSTLRMDFMHFVAMQLIMHMSMDITSLHPLPGAARGSTNGHMLPVFTKVHIPRHNTSKFQCPCAVLGYNNTNKATFVGDDYYCESGFVHRQERLA